MTSVLSDFTEYDADAASCSHDHDFDPNLYQMAKEQRAQDEWDDRAPIFYRWLHEEDGHEYAPALFTGGAVAAYTMDRIKADWLAYRTWDLTDNDVFAATAELAEALDDEASYRAMHAPHIISRLLRKI